MEPHLFEAAIDKQLGELQKEKERKESQAEEGGSGAKDKNDLVLYRSISMLISPAPQTCFYHKYMRTWEESLLSFLRAHR